MKEIQKLSKTKLVAFIVIIAFGYSCSNQGCLPISSNEFSEVDITSFDCAEPCLKKFDINTFIENDSIKGLYQICTEEIESIMLLFDKNSNLINKSPFAKEAILRFKENYNTPSLEWISFDALTSFYHIRSILTNEGVADITRMQFDDAYSKLNSATGALYGILRESFNMRINNRFYNFVNEGRIYQVKCPNDGKPSITEYFLKEEPKKKLEFVGQSPSPKN